MSTTPLNQPAVLVTHIETQAADQFRLRRLNEFVLRLLPPAGRVLDFGCGAGHLLHLINRQAAVSKSFGAEVDDRLLAQCRANNPRSQIIDERTDKKIPLNYFDRLYTLDVLEHIEDDAATLRQLAAALKPGGRLLVAVPAHQHLYTDFDREIGHFRRYETGELRAKLQAAGLTVQQIRFWNFLGYLAVKRAVAKNRPRPRTVDQRRGFKQQLFNSLMLFWFWAVENRAHPKTGLTLLAVAYKPAPRQQRRSHQPPPASVSKP